MKRREFIAATAALLARRRVCGRRGRAIGLGFLPTADASGGPPNFDARVSCCLPDAADFSGARSWQLSGVHRTGCQNDRDAAPDPQRTLQRRPICWL